MKSWEDLYTFFSGNPWLNIIFFILAVLGIVISIILYRKSKKEKKPYYNLTNIPLIEENIFTLKNLSLDFQGEKLSRLSLATISIWNEGREVINYDDVASSDPIRIDINEEGEILDAVVFYSNEYSNNFSITLSENRKSVFVKFEYIYNMQGVILRLYHTGPASDHIFTIRGKIKQAGSIKFKGLADDYKYIYRPYIFIATKLKIKKANSFLYYIILVLTMPIMIVKTFRRIIKRGRNEFILDDDIQ